MPDLELPDGVLHAYVYLAEKLLVASYGAGLPLQGEDVRCVVRAARLFYDEVEHPTAEPTAALKAEEGDD